MKHHDCITLITFHFLKLSKSQTWLHIYEANMHLWDTDNLQNIMDDKSVLKQSYAALEALKIV